MANRRKEMFEYKQIIHRMRQGESNRAIAQTGLVGRIKAKMIRCIATINGWLNPDSTLPSEQEIATKFTISNNTAKTITKLDAYRSQIDLWLQQGHSYKIIHKNLVKQYQFTGSYYCIQRYAKKINNNSLDNLTVPLYFAPGEAAQLDFGQGPKIFDPSCGCLVNTWFFVITLCFSRHQYAEIIRHQDVATWLGCHKRAFEWFGGIPRKLIIDNAKCAITKACYYDPELQRSYMEQAEEYGFIVSPCPPYDPSKKGIVESGVKYIKKNFLPLRNFQHITDSNSQLKQWILEEAGNRIHGTTKKKPLSQFVEIEKSLLLPLPEIMPELSTWSKVRSHRDCHVRYDNSRYSVPYKLAKQDLWLKSTENTIKIYQDYVMVAIHCRSHHVGATITILDHLPPNAKNFLIQDKEWCMEQAKLIGLCCETMINKLLNESVTDNLRAAQAIIKLQTTFGGVRLEAACNRAIKFGAIGYKAIKEILSNGLDVINTKDPESLNQLEEAYSGSGKFCRDPKELTIH
jgi:transposase